MFNYHPVVGNDMYCSAYVTFLFAEVLFIVISTTVSFSLVMFILRNWMSWKHHLILAQLFSLRNDSGCYITTLLYLIKVKSTVHKEFMMILQCTHDKLCWPSLCSS